MIDQLSHPLPAKRSDAIRQLADWGPFAFPELRKAARDADLETALSARDLLGELENAVLIGARVRLHVEPGRAAWDEPVSLVIQVHNPTEDPIKLPWSAESATTSRPADLPAPLPDHQQVAALLDAAEYLEVFEAKDEPLMLRVDPLERDPRVLDAVQTRAGDDAPTHMLPPGKQSFLIIPNINRGWARYPLLKPGTYRIQFGYQPQWKDETWTRQKYGLVRAEPVTIMITGQPPEAILQGETPMIMTLKPEGDELRAVVQNLWDRPQWVNLNFNGDLFTHGKLEWTLERNTYSHEESMESPRDKFIRPEERTGAKFDGKRVHKLEPGESMVLARMDKQDILDRAEAIDLSRDVTWRLSVSYIHIPAAPVIRMNLGTQEKAAQEAVPVHLYTGHLRDDFHFDPAEPGWHAVKQGLSTTRDE